MLKVTDEKNTTKIEFILDEEPLSRLIINHLRINVWGKEFTAGGIGGVRTKEGHRKKGYSRIVLEESLSIMSKKGFDFSLLFGIPDYYSRWGFVSCLPQNTVAIKTYLAEKARSFHRTVKLMPEHMEEVLRIYNLKNRSRTGTVIRDPDRFKAFGLGSTFGIKAGGYVFLKDEKIEGYIILDDIKRRVNACEISALNPLVYHSALNFLAEEAVERRVESISANLPADHLFALVARGFGATVTTNYIYNADGMGRIIDQKRVLQALGPSLFANAGLDQREVTLIFETDLQRTKIGSGSIHYSITLDQKYLLQLLFGYRDAITLSYENLLTTDLERERIAAMFPMQIPHLSGPDKF